MVIKYPRIATAAYNFYAKLFREGRPDDAYKNLPRQTQKELDKAVETGNIPASYDHDLVLAIKCAREMYKLEPEPKVEPQVPENESDKIQVPVSNR